MKTLSRIILMMLPAVLLIEPLAAQSVGEKAPDFSFKNTSGIDVKLSDYSGKVVFLFLLGSTCPNCKNVGHQTETQINKIFSANEDFQALGLDLWDGNISEVYAFIQFTGLTYPVLLNAGSMYTKYSTTYDRGIVIDRNGNIVFKGARNVANDLSNIVDVLNAQFSVTALEDIDGSPGYSLGPAYPNPASHTTSLSFSIEEAGKVDLSLYNSLGQLVKVILNSELQAGRHDYTIRTSGLSDGMYYYKINAGSYTATRKLLVRK